MEMGDAPRHSESQTRLLGGTEQNWCKAVAGGTGITALALQISKEPNIPLFKKALQKLQNDHPILNYMLHKNTSTGSTSFIMNPSIPHIRLNIMNQMKTSELLKTLTSRDSNATLSPLHTILEYEININEWTDIATRSSCMGGLHLWFVSVYTLPDQKWVLVLRLHAGICDRTTAVSLLKELKEAMVVEGGGYKEKGNVGIEELIPVGKAKKTFWAHGKDMVAYSVNSLTLTNLKFKDVKSPRRSEVVRLKMSAEETHKLLAGCKLRGIKLCGALVAATLLAAYSSKRRPSNSNRKKYGVVFLNDCRPYLQPSLSTHEFGFYHSAISTSQEVKGEETLWDLATKVYMTFENSKNNNKHFSDMADLNFLMSKAIENPSLTPSSSLRSSLVSTFEDPIIENSSDHERELGLDDYIGCASAHGIGPSIGLFDTVRDGQLDCACVYPAPLHSREQMQELIAKMKTILLESLKMEGKA
ncbi:putative chloramphenicol acetyltransferase-like domain superfamily [Helianthus debilis subsp. tardiflorus]